MDERLTSWAAGFFDGEGHVGLYQVKGKNCLRINCIVAQTTLEPLEKFLSAVKIGKIHGPYQHNKSKQDHHKQYWQWSNNNSYRNTIIVYRLLRDYLCTPKREQFEDVLKEYEHYLRTTKYVKLKVLNYETLQPE